MAAHCQRQRIELVVRFDSRKMDPNDRASHPGIGRGRSELVISGSAILMTILRLWPVDRFRIADRGLREGILYGLLQARRDRRQNG